VLSSGLYAIPALIGALATVVAMLTGHYGVVSAVGAAMLCFAGRIVGVHFDLNAPTPPAAPNQEQGDDERSPD